MEEDEFEDYDREVELALYKEYRDVVGQFRIPLRELRATWSATIPRRFEP